MQTNPSPPILHSFAYSLDFLHELLADIPEADMVAQPSGLTNHPAWTIGHLTNICQMIGEVLGVPPWLPEDFASRFGSGSVPAAERAFYEPTPDALARLSDAQSRVSRAVHALDDTSLDAPFPDPAYHDIFPTIRHALTQVLIAHTAYHIGQLSVWRKAMNLPPLQRGFE